MSTVEWSAVIIIVADDIFASVVVVVLLGGADSIVQLVAEFVAEKREHVDRNNTVAFVAVDIVAIGRPLGVAHSTDVPPGVVGIDALDALADGDADRDAAPKADSTDGHAGHTADAVHEDYMHREDYTSAQKA